MGLNIKTFAFGVAALVVATFIFGFLKNHSDAYMAKMAADKKA